MTSIGIALAPGPTLNVPEHGAQVALFPLSFRAKYDPHLGKSLHDKGL
jgi:hypothetical protein